MKKKYLFMATAAIMMAGCASDDLVGDENISSGETPIAFSMNTPNATRAITNGKYTESDAATKLNNMFIVWGEKEETASAASAGKLVFENYVVRHDVTDTSAGATATTNYTANSTTSNTNGWEYVGVDHAFIHNNNEGGTDYVTSNIGKNVAQTIKYWDDNATSYTFTAVSALESDISSGKVIIAKTASGNDVYAKGYTINVKSEATTGSIYYADRKNVAKGNDGYNHQPVELTFRNFQSKIRFGIYETVPGYKVVITGLKYTTKAAEGENAATVAEHKSTSTGEGEKTFGITGNFIVAGDNTKYTVTYESAGTNQNRAKVAVDTNSSQETYKNTTGTTWLSTSWTNTTTNTCIGTSSNAPTWDNATTTTTGNTSTTVGNYTDILPNPSNKTNLKLEISYDLYSEDTGEKITVGYKTAEVPAQYCQWKSNYAYTYLFKITDKSAELYPITFDACVETEETGNQETITTVSEPSITTFATTTANSKTTYVTEKNEYQAGNTIYATVLDGSSIATLTTTDGDKCVKLYTVTTTDADKYPITEASVANAITNSKTSPISCTAVTVNASGETLPVLTTTVPTEDGKTIALANSGKALKWLAAANTVYAIEYVKGANTKYYKIVTIGGAKTTTTTGGNTGGSGDSGGN